jgi:hypothetical protein
LTALSLTALILLCQVEAGCVGEVGDEEWVEAAGEVAHDAAEDLFAAESLFRASGGVGAGLLGVVDKPVVGDCPERRMSRAPWIFRRRSGDGIVSGECDGGRLPDGLRVEVALDGEREVGEVAVAR